ncbi:MAG: flagellar biosynthesis anti-sigma factor FlgM [Synergistaceae bacterium]|nr:flagellar biosynthesis anti-sigma factor FlgM [Synergistaceae bacterium]
MIEKITGQYGIDAIARAKAKKGYEAGSSKNGTDEASFSSFAVELARISGELKSVPEVRQDVVDDLKKKVEAGEYRPPLDKIAHNLFLAGILNGEDASA